MSTPRPAPPRDALDKLILAKAAERAEDVYNPGTYSLDLKGAGITRKEVAGQPIRYRFDVMIPVRPDRFDQRVSEWHRRLYRKDVFGQVRLQKGTDDDPMMSERTLVVFWTTLFVAFDGQIFHEPELGMLMNVGQVPAEIEL